MKIRPVEPRDFGAIAEMTNHYIRETAIHFSEVPVTSDELRASWEEGRDRYPYFVAEGALASSVASGRASTSAGAGAGTSMRADAAALLGYAKAGPWRTRSAYRFTAEIGIYVDHRAHGRGIGRALYGTLIDACRTAGFHALIGGITMPNESSVRLHEHFGFERVGVFPQVGLKFDAWHDVGFWQLTFAPPERPDRGTND